MPLLTGSQRAARWLVAVESQGWVYENRPSAAAAPARQLDWPNPGPEVSSLVAINSQQWVFENLRATNPSLPPPVNWPNPSVLLLRRQIAEAIESQANVFRNLPDSTTPFTPVDWANPSFRSVLLARGIAVTSQDDLTRGLWTQAYIAVRNDVVLATGTGTVYLTAAAIVGTGGIIVVKNIGAGVITVDANGAETIDGALTSVLAVQYASVTLITNGTAWSII